MFGQNLVAPFLLAAVLGSTTALAQVQAGRDAYSRGSIPWGCYTVRSPSASVYQTGNAANPQICAVSFTFVTLPFPLFSSLYPSPHYSCGWQCISIDSMTDTQDNCSVKRPQDASEPLFYYWQGSTQLCYCGNGYQNPSQQATAEYPCYTGVTDLRALWTSGRVSTTFTTFGTLCRTRAQVNLADSAFTVQGTAIGPYSCQNQCRSNRFAFWWADVRQSFSLLPPVKMSDERDQEDSRVRWTYRGPARITDAQTTGNAQRCACSNTVVTAQNDVAACGPGNVFVSSLRFSRFSLCPYAFTTLPQQARSVGMEIGAKSKHEASVNDTRYTNTLSLPKLLLSIVERSPLPPRTPRRSSCAPRASWRAPSGPRVERMWRTASRYVHYHMVSSCRPWSDGRPALVPDIIA